MSRIEFKNLPDQTTPITAENLNKLNNLAIDTSVGEHEEEVVLVKSNNIAYTTIEQGALNGSTGVPYSETTRIRTANFIYVKSGETYTINWKENLSAYVFFYNSNGTYLSNIGSWKTKGSNFTIPSGASLIKIVWKDSTNDSATLTSSSISEFMLNEGTTALPYEKPVTKEIYANAEKYTDTLNIGVEPNNSGLWVDYQAGFNKNTATTGKAINGNDGTLYNASTYSVSDYILLKAGTYGVSSIRAYATYKASDKSFVSFTDNATTITLTSDSYVRLMYLTANVNSVSISIPSSIKVNNNGVYEEIVGTHYNDSSILTNIKKIEVIPSAGTNYSGYGGCYYYKVNDMVYAHIGVGGLTANTQQTVMYLPVGYRPKGMRANCGIAGNVKNQSRCAVDSSNGAIYVSSADTYALIDISFPAEQ